jgi:nitrogen regulatory protein P-II 1
MQTLNSHGAETALKEGTSTMKEITAVIRPEKLDAVREAIEGTGHAGITVIDVDGHGKQKGIYQTWRGEQFRVELLPKIMVRVVVRDGDTKRIIDAIMKSAKTGQEGDGKIFVKPIESVFRIRTGESGDAAI